MHMHVYMCSTYQTVCSHSHRHTICRVLSFVRPAAPCYVNAATECTSVIRVLASAPVATGAADHVRRMGPALSSDYMYCINVCYTYTRLVVTVFFNTFLYFTQPRAWPGAAPRPRPSERSERSVVRLLTKIDGSVRRLALRWRFTALGAAAGAAATGGAHPEQRVASQVSTEVAHAHRQLRARRV